MNVDFGNLLMIFILPVLSEVNHQCSYLSMNLAVNAHYSAAPNSFLSLTCELALIKIYVKLRARFAQ